jgi:hypothetical protein
MLNIDLPKIPWEGYRWVVDRDHLWGADFHKIRLQKRKTLWKFSWWSTVDDGSTMFYGAHRDNWNSYAEYVQATALATLERYNRLCKIRGEIADFDRNLG